MIYTYLVSPKDAFRQFDTHHSGKLSFIEFNNLIVSLMELAGLESPPYAIIKDLFEYINKKKDGKLSMTEWMDAFG